MWDRTILKHNGKNAEETDIAHLKNRMYPRLHNSLTVRDDPRKTIITLVLEYLGIIVLLYAEYLSLNTDCFSLIQHTCKTVGKKLYIFKYFFIFKDI